MFGDSTVDAAASEVAGTGTGTVQTTTNQPGSGPAPTGTDPRRIVATRSNEHEAEHTVAKLKAQYPDHKFEIKPEGTRHSIFVIGKLNGPDYDAMKGVAIDAVVDHPRK